MRNRNVFALLLLSLGFLTVANAAFAQQPVKKENKISLPSALKKITKAMENKPA